MKVLAELVSGCDYSKKQFDKRFESMFDSNGRSEMYKIVVIVDNVTK